MKELQTWNHAAVTKVFEDRLDCDQRQELKNANSSGDLEEEFTEKMSDFQSM